MLSIIPIHIVVGLGMIGCLLAGACCIVFGTDKDNGKIALYGVALVIVFIIMAMLADAGFLP